MSIGSKIQKNIPLAPLTSFQIGGPAKFFIEAETPQDLVEAVGWAKENGEKWYILGGGSNLLAGDKGFDGLVIKNKCALIEWDGNMAKAQGGAILAKLAFDAADRGLSGLEWSAGIPGTVGGAIRGNSGAHGSSMQAVIRSVTVFDPEKHATVELPNERCKFSYRHSIFKETGWIALAAVVILKPGKSDEIKGMMQGYVSRRSANYPKEPNAGSVFKNFTVDEVREANLELFRAAERDAVIAGGKISAGWIISRLGFKGKQVGGAMVSNEHGNFIVNHGGASAEDVLVLMSLIKQKVRVEFGLQLIAEIEYLDY